MQPRILILTLVLLCMTPLAVSSACAQGERGLSVSQVDATWFPKVTVYVEAPVELGDVQPAQVRLTEDGARQQVTEVGGVGEEGAQPLTSIVLALDASSSMESAMEDAKAALSFVSNIGDFDRVAVVEFTNKVAVPQEATWERDDLSAAIEDIEPRRTTALYDAIMRGVELLSEEVERRAIVVMTDGKDVASAASLEEAIGAATEAGVPVHIIGLRTIALDGEPLQQIAEETGGHYHSTSEPEQLAGLYQEIAGGLQAQFAVTYETSNDDTDGKQRQVQVELAGEQMTASYRAPTWEEYRARREKALGARLERALEYTTEGKVEMAIDEFEMVLEIDEDNARARAGMALAYIKEGKVEIGLENLDLAIEAAPEDPQVQMTAALAYLEADEMQRATERLDLVLDLAPLDMDLRKQAGENYLVTGEYEKAIEALELVAEQRPDDAEAHFYLAKAYHKAGQRDEAFAQLHLVLKLKPDSVAAEKLSEQWRQGKPWERPGSRAGQEIVGPAGITLVWVPGGSFMMGSEVGYVDQKPVHRVELSGFWIGKTEVTNEQYAAFLNDAGPDDASEWLEVDDEDCEIERTGGRYEAKSGRGDHPVVEVSWYGAEAYCEHYGFELPTEAQWEYAARGPDSLRYPWGDEWQPDRLCWDENQGPGGRTFPVGSFPSGASWCGALDMAGNVWEWCADWYDSDYYGSSPTTDPTGPSSGDERVIRGGSWFNSASNCRGALRGRNTRDNTSADCGFRVARSCRHEAQARRTDEKIAFVSDRDGNYEIYVMNPDGSDVTRLTHDPALDYHPAWSPDGTRIAFASNREGNFDIYVMDPDGSNMRALTSGPKNDYSPSWSPDGRRLVFDRRAGDETVVTEADIFVINSDGTGSREVVGEGDGTHRTGHQFDPCWTADGKHVVYVWASDNQTPGASISISRINGNGSVGMYAFAGTESGEVLGFGRTLGPEWAPNDTALAVYALSDSGHDIGVVSGRGDVAAIQQGTDPSWSPDSSQLAYEGKETDPSGLDIFVCNRDGSDERRLTTHPAKDIMPAWGGTRTYSRGLLTERLHVLDAYWKRFDDTGIRGIEMGKDGRSATVQLQEKAHHFVRSDGDWVLREEARDQSSGASVQVVSEPAGAEVHVNGHLKGLTPCDVPVASATDEPRQYDIVVRADGYLPGYQPVELVKGCDESLEFDLQPAEALKPIIEERFDDVWKDDWGPQREYSIEALIDRGIMADVDGDDQLEFVVEVNLVPSRQLRDSWSHGEIRFPYLMACCDLGSTQPVLRRLHCVAEISHAGPISPVAHDVNHDGLAEVLVCEDAVFFAANRADYVLLDLSRQTSRELLRFTAVDDGQRPRGTDRTYFVEGRGTVVNRITWEHGKRYDRALVHSEFARFDNDGSIRETLEELGVRGKFEWSESEGKYVGHINMPE